MRDAFQQLADDLFRDLGGEEVLLCSLRGEDSDFVRFNKAEVRQAGSVSQKTFGLELIRGKRHAAATVTLGGDHALDLATLRATLRDLRERLPLLPEDPYLLYATEVRSTTKHSEDRLPDPAHAVDEIRRASKGKDLVGVYAAGGIYAGLANSLGQRNWFDTRTFNFDWTYYHSGDKAVKSGYAGFEWEPEAFRRKVDLATRQLAVLGRKPYVIPPGRYRVYLSPAAVEDVMGLLSWGGFGLKALKTKASPLVRLASGQAGLHPSLTVRENTAEGTAPDFQDEGFLKPATVPLIEGGRHAGSLVSPRSAREYGVPTNGANDHETPESTDVDPGDLPTADVLRRLGTGVWIGNIWYLNFSDRPACRTTGLTRFATFWVEDGEIRAPLSVMRFDETVYRMLGENLAGLTAEREMILSPGTYGHRETSSGRFPGALVEDFAFTL